MLIWAIVKCGASPWVELAQHLTVALCAVYIQKTYLHDGLIEILKYDVSLILTVLSSFPLLLVGNNGLLFQEYILQRI